MKMPIRFILIDDDFVSNFLSTTIIESVAAGSEIEAFEDPEIGLECISKIPINDKSQVILFLDINMPVWSGWDFLENFEKLGNNIKDHFKIYMLSSSIEPRDMQRAVENKNVTGYLEKPLSEKNIRDILKNVSAMAKKFH